MLGAIRRRSRVYSEALLRTLMALALATLPLRAAISQGGEFVTRGIVMTASGQRLEGKMAKSKLTMGPSSTRIR